jgi:GT2 family glycosyltransferase
LEKYASEKKPLSVENSLSNTFCPYIVTANLGVRYAVFYQVGLFRSHLTTGGDIDFSWRVLRQTSWQYFYAKKAVILHRHRANFKDLKKQWKRYGKGIYYLEKIYGIDIDNTEISIIKDMYCVGLFLLKLPIKIIKLITGKSTLLEFFSMPIELVIRYSYQSGKHNAKLSEEAMQIPQLNILKPVLK